MSSSDAPSADGPGGGLLASQAIQDAHRSVQQVVGREVTREEVASLIGKIQQLEEANRAQQGRIEKLQESKAQEMAKIVDETIMKWVNDLKFKDEETKQRFVEGAQVLAKNAKDDSGAWEIMCLASASHLQNVNRIEALTQRVTEYESKESMLRGGGVFGSDEDRMHQGGGGKRGAASLGEPIPASAHSDDSSRPGKRRDIWSDIESMLMQGGGNVGMDTTLPQTTAGQEIMRGL